MVRCIQQIKLIHNCYTFQVLSHAIRFTEIHFIVIQIFFLLKFIT